MSTLIRTSVLASVLASGILAGAVAHAQVVNPAPGAGDVQLRYNNPNSGSQQIMEAGTGAQGNANGSTSGSGGAMEVTTSGGPSLESLLNPLGGEGDGGLIDPIAMDRISSLSSGRRNQDLFVSGNQIYRGVIPNETDSLPHIARHQRRAESGGRNVLTWIGYQPFDDYTRIFIQTGRMADYQVTESPDGLTLTVRLRSTDISLSNFRRNINAAFFGRAVTNVTARPAGGGATDVIIELFEPADYTIGTADNSDYIFIDFAE